MQRCTTHQWTTNLKNDKLEINLMLNPAEWLIKAVTFFEPVFSINLAWLIMWVYFLHCSPLLWLLESFFPYFCGAPLALHDIWLWVSAFAPVCCCMMPLHWQLCKHRSVSRVKSRLSLGIKNPFIDFFCQSHLILSWIFGLISFWPYTQYGVGLKLDLSLVSHSQSSVPPLLTLEYLAFRTHCRWRILWLGWWPRLTYESFVWL